MCEKDLKDKINSIVNEQNNTSSTGKKRTNTEERNCSYEASYEAIRHWCDAQNRWTAESCLILANIVFGWMPTAILFYADSNSALSESQEENLGVVIENMAAQIAEMINTNEFISDQSGASIDVLKHFLKNSYVGASKFLHFIYPHHYAMWDRNVLNAITSEKPSISMKIDNLQDFLSYQEAMKLFVLKNADMSLRDVELRIFKAGQNKSGDKR